MNTNGVNFDGIDEIYSDFIGELIRGKLFKYADSEKTILLTDYEIANIFRIDEKECLGLLLDIYKNNNFVNSIIVEIDYDEIILKKRQMKINKIKERIKKD